MNTLRPDEAFACGVAARALGAEVCPLDVPGAAQSTPDAEIQFPDGRRGLLEITWLAASESFRLESRLAAIDHKLPNPGRWAWTANVGNVPELDRLVQVYGRLIEQLERYDVNRVDLLPLSIVASDPDLDWLIQSDTDLVGLPTLPSSEQLRPVWVHGPGSSAVCDAEADVITPALQAALAVEPAVGHIAKLLAHEADERHLFFLVNLSGLSPEAAYELIDAHQAPRLPLEVPKGISDIWLCPRYGWTATRWSRTAGSQLVRFD